MARLKLTQKIIPTLKTDRPRGQRWYDTELAGFGAQLCRPLVVAVRVTLGGLCATVAGVRHCLAR